LKNYDCFKKEFARLFETLKPPKMHEFLSEKIEPPMVIFIYLLVAYEKDQKNLLHTFTEDP